MNSLDKIMSAYLTSGAIAKIVTGKCTQNDLKPALQVTFINRLITTRNGKQWYLVVLSDGYCMKFGLIPDEIYKSNDLQECYIVQLTKFQLYNIKDEGTSISVILCFGLIVTDRNIGYLGAPEPLPENDRPLFDKITPTTIPDEDHFEETSTSKQNPSISTKRPSSHSKTQNKKRKLQSSNDAFSVFGKDISETGINLTSGAISKIMTGKCTENDMQPVLQLIFIESGLIRCINGKKLHLVALSDGSFIRSGLIPDEIFISNKLQKGSIVQLTKFRVIKGGNDMAAISELGFKRHICVCDLNLLCSKCDSIGDPELLVDDEIMGFDLTPGAITKMVTGKCTSSDLRPVLQVVYIYSHLRVVPGEMVVFSDGSFMHSGYMPSEIFISNKLQIGSIVQLTKFRTIDLHNRKGEIDIKSNILCYDLTVIHSECGIIGDPKILPDNKIPLLERTTPTIPSSSDAISVFKKDISETGINLTSGAISKIMTVKCTHNDLQPVLQLIDYQLSRSIDNQQWYLVVLSDGSFVQYGLIPDEMFIWNKLQKGSIVQLTQFRVTKGGNTIAAMAEIGINRHIRVWSLNLLCSKCDIIGNPELLVDNDQNVNLTPGAITKMVTGKCTSNDLRTTPTIPDEDHVKEPPTSKQKQDHVDSLLNEDIDDSHHVEDPSTSIQNPSTSTQKCSSHSPTQDKKRKLLSSDDIISGFGKDVSKLVSEIVEKTTEDGLDACFKKLGTFEDVSKLTRMMMEKNKEDDVGVCFKKLETLEEDVSKLTRMMMEKNKEDDMGACIEKLDKLGWGAENPLYDTALLLFGQSADYRKLWLHLKPESCGKWVKNAGSMFGLLD